MTDAFNNLTVLVGQQKGCVRLVSLDFDQIAIPWPDTLITIISSGNWSVHCHTPSCAYMRIRLLVLFSVI